MLVYVIKVTLLGTKPPIWYKASDLASRPNRERYHAWPIAWCATDRNGLDQFPFASVRDAQAEAP